MVMHANADPVYFWENEYFLNTPQWPMQKEIGRTFYWGIPKDKYTVDEWLAESARIRESERVHYTHLFFLAGMRSSKTYMGGNFSCYEAFQLITKQTPAEYYGLAPGSEIFIINCATSKDQARDTVFAHTAARINNSPWFYSQNYNQIQIEFRFPDINLVLRSGGSNSSGLVGKTCKSVLLDELERFLDTAGRSSGRAVFESLSRSVKTF